ncbi:MAG: 23S rRNA (guanosine(2251)-2'-O)-methyltransferase RlmB [Spirochaetaceae bacterium]|jgi:23S rRNA (guanosine2251-2'-O)-methyltransferase|nr:23S rRNA (guanosine(2251)-2'-O)-methyltransferase RlmB [Spirochaetaceae bacterium]
MAYLTGFHAIEEHIRSGGSAQALLVAKAGPRAQEIVRLAVQKHIRIDRVGAHDLDRISQNHRGIALETPNPPDRRDVSLESFLENLDAKQNWTVVILDEITDPHNYGAIIRSCDQFGVDLVLTRNKRIAKQTDAAAKASAGAVAWVPHIEVPNLPRAVGALKQAGFWMYGADMTGEPVWTKNMTGRCAVVFGGEGSGLSRLLSENCDALVALPCLGHVDSLNVSVAAGAILYEITRQRMSKEHRVGKGH